jgi:hypothetical protein
MQPSDSLVSFSRGFGSPRRRPTSWGRRLFCRRCRRPARAPADAPVLGIDHRLPIRPEAPEERQGPPGLLGRPLPACRGATPRRTRPLLAPTSLREDRRKGRHRLREQTERSASGTIIVFEATVPRPTRSRAYASPASLPKTVARLATGSGGLTPGRAGFAPAGRRIEVSWSHRTLQSQSTSRAWSHCLAYPRESVDRLCDAVVSVL